MNQWFRAAALSLCLCAAATACAPADAASEKAPEAPSRILEAAAGVEEETVLLRLDGREVPAWRYLCWLDRACGALQEKYDAGGLRLDWDAPFTGGTLADYAKDRALSDTALYAAVESLAEQEGCSLTAEDRELLAARWAEAAEDAGGEEALLRELAGHGLDRERWLELRGVGRMYEKLLDLALTGESALSPETEALAAFAEDAGLLTADRLLFPFGEDREAAGERAAEAFSRLNAALDRDRVFEDLGPSAPVVFRPGDGVWETALESAAAGLETGQCSGILECREGFCILRRRSTDLSRLREDWFDQQLQAAAGSAELETSGEYDALRAGDFYSALCSARTAGAP